MIQFKRECILKNGNKLNKYNWQNVIAKSTRACTNVNGVKEIDRLRQLHGVYHESWVIKKEMEGYIFREVNHNGGINGHHKTYRLAVFYAINVTPYIEIFLDTEKNNPF